MCIRDSYYDTKHEPITQPIIQITDKRRSLGKRTKNGTVKSIIKYGNIDARNNDAISLEHIAMKNSKAIIERLNLIPTRMACLISPSNTMPRIRDIARGVSHENLNKIRVKKANRPIKKFSLNFMKVYSPRSTNSTLILSPLLTLENTEGSPIILPNTFTGLAGLISSGDLLAGVGPQNIHKLFPGGQ
mgnify:CR=1 FL=1